MFDHPSAVDIAVRAGIDLALTEYNLRLSFEQRALQQQAALDLACKSRALDSAFVSDLQALLLRLDDAGIDFVLLGGYAAMLHGSSLLTRDLDVCAALTPDTIEKLRDAFRDFHPRHRLSVPQQSFLEEPDPGVALSSLYLNTDLGTLDLLRSITGVGDYTRVASNAVETELLGRRIRAIALDDLIASKEALGRDKDLLAVKELRVIRDKLSGR